MDAFLIFSYLRLPFFIESPGFATLLRKPGAVLNLWILATSVIFVTAGLVVKFDDILVDVLHIPSIRDNLARTDARHEARFNFIQILILFPLIEELMFRLGLSCRRAAFCFSTSFFAYGLMGGSINRLDMHLLALALILFAVLYTFLTDRFFDRLKGSYFRYYFYFAALSFGLVHIGNFKPIYWEVFYVYPFFVLPHMAMGIFISYTRIKHGFLSGVLMHLLFNLTGSIF